MVERITAPEAKRRIDEEGYAYLDVRSVPEFEQGHPEGAYNLPLMHLSGGSMVPNPDFVPVAQRTFEPHQKLVVGCKSGARSARACEQLTAAGFTNVVDLGPGFGGVRGAFGEMTEKGWEAEGLPTSSEAAPGRSWAELER